MTISTNKTTRSRNDAVHETSKFALGVGISSAALLGIWASVCMVSAVMNNGIITVVKGLLGTMVGS